MYRMNKQMRIEDFVFPYGQLDKNNEWVKLADLEPSYISAWWMAMQKSSGFPLTLSTKQPIFSAP